ncbi:hypothetical protein ABTE31_21425, partial [Acinetobacter baumannii]
QQGRVCPNGAGIPLVFDDDLDVATEQSLEHLDGVVDQGFENDDLRLQRLAPRECQQTFGQLRTLFCGVDDILEYFEVRR